MLGDAVVVVGSKLERTLRLSDPVEPGKSFVVVWLGLVVGC